MGTALGCQMMPQKRCGITQEAVGYLFSGCILQFKVVDLVARLLKLVHQLLLVFGPVFQCARPLQFKLGYHFLLVAIGSLQVLDLSFQDLSFVSQLLDFVRKPLLGLDSFKLLLIVLFAYHSCVAFILA